MTTNRYNYNKVLQPTSRSMARPHQECAHRNIRQVLAPLIARLDNYDRLRIALQQKGGQIDDLKQITTVLRNKFTVTGPYGTHSASLTDQKKLKYLVNSVGSGTIFLDIRKQKHGLPVYYLCRVLRDYWSEYSQIVEDLYLSPGYCLPDTRFVKLMHFGHESYYLRMSQFRSALIAHCDCQQNEMEATVDSLLYEVGRYCFISMWHDDQRPAIATAQHFKLKQFQEAIELLYLCLSANLCELRSHITPFVIDFFTDNYPQPAINKLLQNMLLMDGTELNKLPQLALRLLTRLNEAFRAFLATEVDRNGLSTQLEQTTLQLDIETDRREIETVTPTPLFKLVFGNFYQLDALANSLQSHDKVLRAAAKIECEANAVVQAIIDQGASVS